MVRQYKPELKARDATDRFLSRLGLPSEWWGVLLKDFSFRSTAYRGEKLSGMAQRKWCENIVIDPLYAPLFVVGSFPTDRAATALVTWMLRHRSTRGNDRRIIYTNAALDFNYSGTYTSIGIHNATHNSTAQRCEEIRDVLVSYDEAFRVVAVATKTPEVWALNHLHLRPTTIFYLKDM